MRSKFLLNFSVYTLSSIISSAIPFLLMPYLTRKLTPVDYGVVGLFNVFSSFLTPIIGLSAYGLLGVACFSDERDAIPKIFGSSLFVSFVISIFSLLVLALIYPTVGPWIELSYWAICLAAMIVFLGVSAQNLLSLFRAKKMAIHFGLLQIAQAIISFIFTFVFVSYIKQSWEGRVWANLSSALFFFLVSLYLGIKKKWLSVDISPKYVRKIFSFGVPLIFHGIGGLLIAMVDRIFIAKMVNLEQAGLYTLAYQLANVLGIVLTAFNGTFSPWLYERLQSIDENSKRYIVRMTYWCFLPLLIAPFLGTYLAPPFLGFFVGPKFQGAAPYLFWILCGFSLNGAYFLVTNYIFYAKKTGMLAFTTLATGMINIPLCYLLIRLNGAQGAAQSFAASSAICFLATWYISNKVYPMPWFKAYGENVNHTKIN